MTYYEAQSKGKCTKCNRDCTICIEDNVCYDDCNTKVVISMIGGVRLEFYFKNKTEAANVITAMLTNCKQWYKICDTLINKANINYVEIKEKSYA